ncbi:uncharacterized protein LOC111598596 [Drosophila hydei]|uniref:Uncharacterized protein LOC111598596 n=1 Tax=Drosophila hydei TaxID=7224 RepID=A0A6J2SWT2_DROHY|nr:uncharacterized protein LOC111598596 [Drosophila hydei]XP_030081611.1 uncharacterized protein LOC111598596 [Drosophila hydei]
MTYSHNSVRNNIKMTTASATKSIRLKKGATTPTPPPTTTTTAIETATPTVNAHSNSIASSTNYNNQHFQQQVLSTSPIHCAPITPNNRMQQQQQQQQQRLQSQSAGANQRSRQQRQSPQQMGGGGFFFANNNRRNGGGGRSPQSAAVTTGSSNCYVRQSPATILGGGFSPAAFGSARKQRRSPTTTPTNSFGVGGKISPQHPLIPTALTHFAGSKCFDAPAPTALPKPPQHWTTLSKSEEKLVASSAGTALQSLLRGGDRCSASKLQLGHGGIGGYMVKSSKRNLLDDFDTHNLKLLLNVQS